MLTAQFPINCSEKGALAESGNPSSWGKTTTFLQKGYSSIHLDCVGSYLNPELIIFNLLISYLLLFHFFTLNKSLTREETKTSVIPCAAWARSGCPRRSLPTARSTLTSSRHPWGQRASSYIRDAPLGPSWAWDAGRLMPALPLHTGAFPRAAAQVKAPL